MAEKKNWIQDAVNPANKGKLRTALGMPKSGKGNIPAGKLEAATHSKNPTLRHRAQFAKNMKGLKK
jgi:hypothetical protein